MASLERIEWLFHEGRLRPPGVTRRQWLEEQCRDDADVLSEVERLLASHAALSQPSALSQTGVNRPQTEAAVPTATFGAYRAVKLLGRGGMSAVYLAQRSDGSFQHTAALKIMAGYLAGPEFLRRFEIERQVLASLNHNYITRLLDGGVSSAGDPYLITEYVEGQTIDRYCDDRKLEVKARVQLLLQVCEAVAHAHLNLILHRDLKPGNILVDATGTVKLLDFGTAQLAATNEITLTRNRMLTPRYASPEQLRGQRAGMATDIFSLGVVLYELVTGAWPFGDPASTLSELSRAIGDARMQSPAAVVTAEAAADRSVSPEGLRHLLRGDLSAILLKALEDEPARRYESVSQFAADLRNYLAERPVMARPQTVWYRARMFAKRRRLAVIGGAAVLLAIMASSGLLYQVHLRRQENVKQVAGLAKVVEQTFAMIYDNVTKNRLELARAQALQLRDSLEQVRRQNPDDPVVWQMLGHAYSQLGELSWFRYGPSLMDADMALESYSRARILFENVERRLHSIVAFDSVDSTRLFQSELLVEDGRGFEAFAEAVQLLRDDEAKAPKSAGYRAAAIANLASYYDMLSDRLGGNMAWPDGSSPGWYRPLAALQPYRMTDSIAMVLYEAALKAESAKSPATGGNPTVHLQLGRLQHQMGLHEAGMRSLRNALQAYSDTARESHAGGYVEDHIAGVHIQLSRAYEAEGKLVESLREREQGLDVIQKEFSQSPQSFYLKERAGSSQIVTARLLARLGRRAEALQHGKTGLEYLEENADRPRAAALTLDLAAQRLLTVEPLELRDAPRAAGYARHAVQQTASQMPPYLVTLAFAELACGHEDAARRAAILAVNGYRRVANILKPLFDTAQYPQSAQIYNDWRKQLSAFPEYQ
jgi:serine/threonine protein kinase